MLNLFQSVGSVLVTHYREQNSLLCQFSQFVPLFIDHNTTKVTIKGVSREKQKFKGTGYYTSYIELIDELLSDVLLDVHT